jgi:hypothetical protein
LKNEFASSEWAATHARRLVERWRSIEEIRVVPLHFPTFQIVQEGLFQRWIEHAEQAPTIRSDLGRIRHQLDGIATAIMQQLAAIQAFRHPPPFRPARRPEALVPVDALNHLDDLERRALTVALHSVCCPHSRRRLGNSGRGRGRLSLDGFPFPVRKI